MMLFKTNDASALRAYPQHTWFLGWVFAFLDCWMLLPVLNSGSFTLSVYNALPSIVWMLLLAAAIAYIPFSAYAHNKTALKKYLNLYFIYTFIFFVLLFIDRGIFNFIQVIHQAINSESNPSEFIPSMIYMAYQSRYTYLRGISGTLQVSLIGTILGFLIAILLSFMRIQIPDRRDADGIQILKLIGQAFSKTYTTIIRGTPMMVQVLIINAIGFAAARMAMPDAPISEVNKVWSFFLASAITVSLNSAAYLAEVLRGGVDSLDKGQKEAARSLGMTQWQAMMKVIFPQAVKNSIPAIGNEFIINIKDTSVLTTIGFFELMFANSTISGTYYKGLEVYLVTAMIYLLLTYCITKLLNFAARRLDMPTSRGIPSSN